MKIKYLDWSDLQVVPMKLIIIEDDKNECEAFEKIAKSRCDIDFVKITDSDVDALETVKTEIVEGIILDLELNKGSASGTGFTFLEELKKLKLKHVPKIVVTTNVSSDSVYDFLHKSGVDFIFYKKQVNYSHSNVLNTLVLLRDYNIPKGNNLNIPESAEDKSKISNMINDELDLIGIGSHLQGRKYLYDAILFILEESDDNSTVTQYLVKKYMKSNSTISRAMQNSILHAWRISSIDDLTKYYTAKVNYETGVPTPTEFIYYYADKIKKML